MSKRQHLNGLFKLQKLISRILAGSALLCMIPIQLQSESTQCEEDAFLDNCSVTLDDYTYIRSYDAIEVEGSTNYPYSNAYMFGKGTEYIITACDQDNGQKIIVKLYNRSRKLVASNYNEDTGKHYPKIIFQCSATGVFFIQTLVSIKEGGCGISMLGFKSKQY